MTKYRKIGADVAMEILGGMLIALGVYNFALEADFPMTGFSGISLLLYRFLGVPIGLSTVLLNVPVAILCFRLLGRGFFFRSIRCMVLSSLLIDYVAPLLPHYEGNRLLAAICTGVLAGLGYALIYLRSSSTGGTDFIIMAAKKKWPHVTLGKITFITDVTVVLLGGLLMGDADGVIYGMIVSYIMAIVVDRVMYGVDAGKLALVVTRKGQQVADVIETCCGRGSTLLQGQGGFQGEEKKVVMCACNNKQMHLVRQAAKGVDPQAFIIILESNEVLGEGFKTGAA